MAQTQFRQPKGVQLKQPEPAVVAGGIDGLFGEDAGDDVIVRSDGPAGIATPEGFEPLPVYEKGLFPFTGAPVLVTDGENTDEAVWRTTRKFDGGKKDSRYMWVDECFWAKRNAGGQRLTFVPTAWRTIVDVPFVKPAAK